MTAKEISILEIASFGLETGLFAVALFALCYISLRAHHRRDARWLGFAFVAIAFSSIPDFPLPDAAKWEHFSQLGFFAFSFCIAPSIYFYIQAITRETDKPTKWRDFWHFLPAVPATLFALLYFLLPTDIGTNPAYADGTWQRTYARTIIYALIFAQTAIFLQWLYYGHLAHKIISSYRKRVKDFYANMSERDLKWIEWVIAAFLVYALLSSLDMAFELATRKSLFPPVSDELISFALCFCLALFGIHQSPSLLEQASSDPKASENKYAKSGLTEHDMSRIAQKITAAIAENVHLDPDISLRQLSQITGVQTNYLSQTLNEHIGKSFFDFINAHRVNEACKLLENQNANILEVALQSGFNSRSAFYRAFQRETGQTPTAFRANRRK